MQQVFRNALFHWEPTVLGRRLLPLSCGHAYVLMAEGSPYADRARRPTVMDLSFAVAVCSQAFEDGLAWARSLHAASKEATAWGKKCRKMDFTVEDEIFSRYIKVFSMFPRRYSKTKNPTECGHPWPLLIATSIMPVVGESRAWNMPLPMAISLWSAQLELAGDDSIQKDWEAAAVAKMKAEREKKQKEQTNEKVA